jgi:hypothetical protein
MDTCVKLVELYAPVVVLLDAGRTWFDGIEATRAISLSEGR